MSVKTSSDIPVNVTDSISSRCLRLYNFLQLIPKRTSIFLQLISRNKQWLIYSCCMLDQDEVLLIVGSTLELNIACCLISTDLEFSCEFSSNLTSSDLSKYGLCFQRCKPIREKKIKCSSCSIKLTSFLIILPHTQYKSPLA